MKTAISFFAIALAFFLLEVILVTQDLATATTL